MTHPFYEVSSKVELPQPRESCGQILKLAAPIPYAAVVASLLHSARHQAVYHKNRRRSMSHSCVDGLANFQVTIMLKRLWCEDDAVLTLEWIMLTTLVVIGAIAGLAAVRDALMHELGGVVGAAMSLDQSYALSSPIGINICNGGASGNGIYASTSVAGSRMQFVDSTGWSVGRVSADIGQSAIAGCSATSNIGM